MHVHTGINSEWNLQTRICCCVVGGESMRINICVQLSPWRKKHAFWSAVQRVFSNFLASCCSKTRSPGWSVSQWTRATAGDGRRAFLFTVQMISWACVWSCGHWLRTVEMAFTKRTVTIISLWRVSDAMISYTCAMNFGLCFCAFYVRLGSMASCSQIWP